MRKTISLLFIAFLALRAFGTPIRSVHAPDTIPGLHLSGEQQYFVVVFLSPECPLCQNYTSVLSKLSGEYGKKVAFYGVIPGKSYSEDDIAQFRTKYHVGFDLLPDTRFRLTHRLKATTTPQAFLLDHGGGILYEGLIDNWAVSLGVQRSVTTEHYLAAAIDASLHHLPPTIRQTRPVGCLINTK